MPKGKTQTKLAISQGSSKAPASPTSANRSKKIDSEEIPIKSASKKIQKNNRTSADSGPVKPLSSYAIFLKQMSAQMKNMPKFNDLTLAERAKVISESWSKLTSDQKSQYVEMANNDKIRYQNECTAEEPKAAPVIQPKKGAASKATVVIEEKKDEGVKPKRPLSGFLYFGMLNRPKVIELNPDMKIGDVAKVNGEQWGKMTEEEKKPFQDMNLKDIERFEKETQQLAELGYFTNSDGVKSTSLSKKGKVLNFPEGTVMPKKQATGYMVFFKDYHNKNKGTTSGVVATETAKIIGQQWSSLTPEQKEPFEATALKDGDRFNDQINQLKKNGFFMTEDGVKSTDLPQKTKRAKKQ